MPELPFTLLNKGLFRIVDAAVYGQQDQGISPGGAQDRFSYESGQTLLGHNRQHSFCLECVLAPRLQTRLPLTLVLTGAPHQASVTTPNGEKQTLAMNTVSHFPAGSVIHMTERTKGFRLYIHWSEQKQPQTLTVFDAEDACRQWFDPQGRIRLLRGPEYTGLKSPQQLTQTYWRIDSKSNDMGLRLSQGNKQLNYSDPEMVSVPVNDGTVQLTPAGPIILMRQRQTVGGYPRIAQVIDVDIDRLAQFAPEQIIRFTWSTMEEARALQQLKHKTIDALYCTSQQI